MNQIIEFSRLEPISLFDDDGDRRHFMRLIHRLAERWAVRPLAFRLGSGWAAFLVQARSEDALANWVRLSQSGYGVWRYHRGDPVRWRSPARVTLPGEALVRRAADTLHQGLEPDPLLVSWSSLRDGLGLRCAPWFDGRWLAQRGAAALYEAAGGQGRLPERNRLGRFTGAWHLLPPRDPWRVISEAVALSTGREPEARAVRALRVHTAWSRGWGLTSLAVQLRVQPLTIKRLIRRTDPAALDRALLHLEDARLRLTLGTFEEGPVKGWDLPEPPWSRLHSCSNRLESSSPAA